MDMSENIMSRFHPQECCYNCYKAILQFTGRVRVYQFVILGHYKYKEISYEPIKVISGKLHSH